VGRIDATIWYVVGVCQYLIKVNNNENYDEFYASVERAINYLKCLELNGRGLIYIPPGGDWADEYINDGYVLFDQLLYYFALQTAGRIFNRQDWIDKAKFLHESLSVNYFPEAEKVSSQLVYHNSLYKESVRNHKSPFPVASFTPGRVYYHMDVFAISMAFL